MRLFAISFAIIGFLATSSASVQAAGMQPSPSLLPLIALAAAESTPPAARAGAVTPYASPGMEPYMSREGIGEADLVTTDNIAATAAPTPAISRSENEAYVDLPAALPATGSFDASPVAVPGMPLMPSEGVMPASQSYRYGNFTFRQ